MSYTNEILITIMLLLFFYFIVWREVIKPGLISSGVIRYKLNDTKEGKSEK